jgi:hypothetical protein
MRFLGRVNEPLAFLLGSISGRSLTPVTARSDGFIGNAGRGADLGLLFRATTLPRVLWPPFDAEFAERSTAGLPTPWHKSPLPSACFVTLPAGGLAASVLRHAGHFHPVSFERTTDAIISPAEVGNSKYRLTYNTLLKDALLVAAAAAVTLTGRQDGPGHVRARHKMHGTSQCVQARS